MHALHNVINVISWHLNLQHTSTVEADRLTIYSPQLIKRLGQNENFIFRSKLEF